jgi:hypothetical protein
MSKCADSPSVSHWNTKTVATRVVESIVAGLLILMMAACNVGPNYKAGNLYSTDFSGGARAGGSCTCAG